MSSLTVILGPGNHDKHLVAELSTENEFLQVFHYYPRYSERIFKNGFLESVKKSPLLNFLQWFIYGLGNRLGLKVNIYEQWFFDIYDLYVSRRIIGNDLVAWPQVSLQCIKAAKKKSAITSLEYPMIHIEEHQYILLQEYKKLGIAKDKPILSNKAVRKIQKEIDLADKITILSQYARGTFIRHGISENKLILRKLNIDPDFSDYPIVKKDRLKVIFLYVGRMDIQKGVHLLLEAYSGLQKNDCELWLAGDLSPSMVSFYEKYQSETVKLLGKKTKKELIDIYSKAHCLILPSLQESFGLVMQEALRYSCDIIASPYTGVRELNIPDRSHVSILKKVSSQSIRSQMKTYHKWKKESL